MFDQSRWKIVAAILLVLTLVLGGTFCVIYWASYTEMSSEGKSADWNGEKFKLSDVIFDVKDVAERTARNPSTGEKVTVPAHKKISIKAASNLIRDIQ